MEKIKRNGSKKQLHLFDTQSFGIMDTIYELCPYCGTEVEIPAVMAVHECPKCGKKILPCSLCHEEWTDCTKCELELNKCGVDND